MGVKNLRAICPKCGGKIHTQGRGLGKLTWASSSSLVKTGEECQHCGAALSGKVGIDGKAIAAEDADKSFIQRAKEEAGLVESTPDQMDDELTRRTAEWKKGKKRLRRRR
jgi:hypothetical protein